MPNLPHPEAVVIAVSVVSCFFSVLVVGTILFFKEMRQGSLMPIIMYMSLSDFLSNIPSAMGFPPDASVACYVQCVGTVWFTLSSWMWTTFLDRLHRNTTGE